jgi:pSer/pThr/pTyr-binding forkhead associated (FHA) protein
MLITIIHMSGPRDGEVMSVEAAGSPPEIIFGRQTTCTVSLPGDPEASRRHARLVWRNRCCWLEDLGSSNGTFVNEFARQQKIAGPVLVAAGTIFRVGLSRFLIDRLGAPMAVDVQKAEQAT